MSDKVPQKINWPTILIVAALLAGFYYYIKPDAVVKVKKSAYSSAYVKPEVKMAQLEEGVEEPKQKAVDKFHDLITKIYRIYRTRTREEITNSLIFIYKMKKQDYKNLLDFTSKFLKYINNAPLIQLDEHTYSRSLESDLALFVNPPQ